MNNLFSTRFVRNFHNMDSTSPFVIATDSNGKIVLAQPFNMSKISKLAAIFDNIKDGLPFQAESKPFVADKEEEFDEHFNLVVKEVGELASNNPDALELLNEFSWKGMIALMATKLEADYTKPPKFRAKFMINLKAKEH